MDIAIRNKEETSIVVKIFGLLIILTAVIYGIGSNFLTSFPELLNLTGIALCGLFIASFYLSKGWASRFASLTGIIISIIFFSPLLFSWFGDLGQYALSLVFIIFILLAVISRRGTASSFFVNLLITTGLAASTLGITGTAFITSVITAMNKINPGLLALAFALAGILLYFTNKEAAKFASMP